LATTQGVFSGKGQMLIIGTIGFCQRQVRAMALIRRSEIEVTHGG